MKSELCERLGIEFPIFGFSHCRDVVVALSKAGGFGVLGTTRYSPDKLDKELSLITDSLSGRPFGLDLVFPANSEGDDEQALKAAIPSENWGFVDSLIERFHIPTPNNDERLIDEVENRILTHRRARERFEVGLQHRINLFVSALGPAPIDVVQRAHASGAMVAGMVGTPDQARRHAAAGADVVIAIGQEAAGHASQISTMVLVPQVVDAIAPLPVLSGGGIGSGRQFAAALALGAAGVWIGSLWLTTPESDTPLEVKEMLMEASSSDAVVSRCQTGKPTRQLETPWVAAWASPQAPAALPSPKQALLVRDAIAGMVEHEMHDLLGSPVGQIVGMMTAQRSVKDLVYEMIGEFANTLRRLDELAE